MARILCYALAVLLLSPAVICAQELNLIKLPAPQTDKGVPLMQALKNRQSGREYSARELSAQTLADLLWAACGINRPATGGRTAPTAMNLQELEIYVAKADGLYLYDAKANALILVLKEDIRALTGKQAFVKDAPVNLVFVADYAKIKFPDPSARDAFAGMDAGFISQNVYLYCASEGLSTVVRGWCDKKALGEAMKLRPDQGVILAQSVGYPKEAK